jgi:hypothetical protein
VTDEIKRRHDVKLAIYTACAASMAPWMFAENPKDRVDPSDIAKLAMALAIKAERIWASHLLAEEFVGEVHFEMNGVDLNKEARGE